MTPPIDIRADHLRLVQDVLHRHLPDGVTVWVFGSRATWMTKDSSDLDLALDGETEIPRRSLSALEAAFEDSDLPFAVDIVDVKRISGRFREIVAQQRVRLRTGEQASPWPTTPLGNLVNNLDSRRIPLSGRVRSTRPGPYPYYGATGVMDRVDDWLFEGRHLLVAEDGSVETSSGTPFLQLVDGQFWVNNHAHVLQGATDEETRYLYYALSTVQVHPFMSGSVQAKLSQRNLNRIPVHYPPERSQKSAIAHVLGTLDDRIELNRRMNATLEAMARALFRSWFVDFDPVRAKMEGRDTGLPKDIADLFPDRLVDSELGEIPEGWSLLPLTELIDVNPKRVLRKGMVAPYLDMANMPTRGHVPDSIGDRSCGSGMRFANGDTLVARITPCLENGKIAFVDFLGDGEVGWGSTEYIVLKPKPPIPDEFAYCLARSARFREFAVQNMSGTSGRQRVPATALSGYRMSVPPRGIATAFGRAARPLLARASARASESRALGAIRDALLPKLVSGELRVNVREPTRRADERPIATAGARA